MAHQYRFGPFWLDPANERLSLGPEEISLRPKSLAVLGHLVSRAGQLVTRGELLQVIWPGITVSDAVLTVCIGEIRQALRDSHYAPQYIETLHRRGYRFRVPSESQTLPRGWNVLFCGELGSDAAWNRVIEDVDELRFHVGDPQLFFIFQVWDIGMDNPTITFGTPEPALETEEPQLMEVETPEPRDGLRFFGVRR